MDRVSFGQVINLNDYLNGYDNIKNKKYEQEVARMQKYQSSQVEKNKNAETIKHEKLQQLANKKRQEDVGGAAPGDDAAAAG